MAISEIEKLERRYAENPQGLTFAPLAEVHRKNGDVPRALELLGPGLALHPDYIPASIVLGRCHLDLGDQHAAEAAFTHVLSLDAENVIALKALAEITERLLRLDESERWLNTLLSVDRSNDEAREQLERVQASRRQAEMGSSASPGADLVMEPPAAESTDVLTPEPMPEKVETEPFSLEPSPVSPPPPPFGDLPAEPGLEWVPASDAPSSEEAVPLAFEDLEPHSADILGEPVEPLSGIVGMTESGDVSHVGPLDESVGDSFHSDSFQVETSEDIVLRSSGATEFQVPNASEEFLGSTPEPPPAIVPEPEPVPEIALIAEPEVAPLSEPEVAPHSEPEPAIASAAEPPLPDQPPDPMMTESMAELLLSQGHREEALRVYRDLDDRLGGDSRLQDRIADLERPKPAPVPQRQYAAGATGGRSTRDFLRSMLSSRPPQVAASPAPRTENARNDNAPDASGAPTRPAHDALSLSSVFGEDATPTRPAVPASGSAAPSGVSFDEFFNAPPSGGSQRPSRSPDSKSDDLDQFHTWLQNLKR
jgi:tetratricopeptide (TPR) repeat protein